MLLWRRIVRKILGKNKRHVTHSVPLCFHALTSSSSPYLTACHSGNLGHIIYACALLKAYWERTHKKIHLHLRTDVPFFYYQPHPLKNILLNRKMAEQLRPLLLLQPYIEKVTIGPKAPDTLDLPLDLFRELPIPLHCGLIQGWYQFLSELWINVYEPWISAPLLPEYGEQIVVTRSSRYRSEFIQYRFLSQYQEQLLFLGIPKEYQQFRKETGITCRSLTVDTFDQMAAIICSCRLFIGNQSFGYALAESMHCPRILEASSLIPNVYPLSPNGRIALYQAPFEAFVQEMMAAPQTSQILHKRIDP